MSEAKKTRALDLIRQAGLIRPRELAAHGICATYLNRLLAEGHLERPARGLYRLQQSSVTAERPIAELAKRVPRGVVCLLSALQLHGMTTQMPTEIWMAIGPRDRIPKIDYPPVRMIRYSGSARSHDIQKRLIEGVEIQVYSPAKTVADCFKFRNLVGLNIALEALRSAIWEHKATMDQIHASARACRMVNVMRPYMESIVS